VGWLILVSQRPDKQMPLRCCPLPDSTSGLRYAVNVVISSGLSVRSRASPVGGMSGFPDMRRNRSQGMGRLMFVTVR
jgi:hypothetical protein